MAAIIRSWGMPEEEEAAIIRILEENLITNERLPELNFELIRELIPQIGLRMQFLKKWNATYGEKSTEKLHVNLTQNEEDHSPSATDETNCPERENAFTGPLSYALRTKTVNVHKILARDPHGRAIIKAYNKTRSLTRQFRSTIIDVILSQLMNETTRLVNADFAHIAEEIVKTFPTERVTTYFIPAIPKKLCPTGKSMISRGKLIDKYRNKCRSLKNINEFMIKSCGESEDGLDESSLANDEAISEAVNWLKNHQVPWELVLRNWKLTAEFRRKNIKSSHPRKLCTIFDKWPILKNPNAYSLIEEDYVSLGLGEHQLTIASWKSFFIRLLAARPLKKDDDNAMALMELIESTESTEDTKTILQLKLLPHLFPPKNRVRLQKTQWKPSISECKDSMVVQITLMADITKVQEERRQLARNLGITLQPFIIAVGSSFGEITDFFMSVDDTLYKVSSALKAIDICYKTFHAFDLEYPIESKHIWLLLQRVLYQYQSSTDQITPNVSEVITDMEKFQTD